MGKNKEKKSVAAKFVLFPLRVLSDHDEPTPQPLHTWYSVGGAGYLFLSRLPKRKTMSRGGVLRVAIRKSCTTAVVKGNQSIRQKAVPSQGHVERPCQSPTRDGATL